MGPGVEMLSPSLWMYSDLRDTGEKFFKTVCTPTCLSQPAWEKAGRMTVVWVETIKFCHWRLELTYCENLLVSCRDSGNRYREVTDQVHDRIPSSKVKMPGLPRLEDFSQSLSPDSYRKCFISHFGIREVCISTTKPNSSFIKIAWIFMLSTNIYSVLKRSKTTC